nr:disulfide isomerase [uncultured bacterium]BAJ06977.1 disulfide isomerase [uncultured bacterium]
MKINKAWVKLFIIIAASNLMVSSALSEEVSLGSNQAPVTIIEYGSLTCGKCLSFHRHVYPKLKKQYIDTGTVRFIFRHFPTGEAAVYGARAVNCTGDKYYEMLDKLFSTTDKWIRAENREAIFVKYATSLELNSEAFVTCIRNKKHLDNILLQQNAARKHLDVIGTPTFFINEKIVRGKRSFLEMEALISEAINKSN